MLRRWVAQKLIDKYNLKVFLEIGVFGGYTFLGLNNLDLKIGVDINFDKFPQSTNNTKNRLFFKETSNKFFDLYLKRGLPSPDLILIDGDHSYEACLRDVENSLKFLKPGGIVLIHDVLNLAKNCGVWRVFLRYVLNNRYSCSFAVKSAYGTGILMENSFNYCRYFLNKPFKDVTFEDYKKFMNVWFNVKTKDQFISFINKVRICSSLPSNLG